MILYIPLIPQGLRGLTGDVFVLCMQCCKATYGSFLNRIYVRQFGEISKNTLDRDKAWISSE